MLKYLQSEFPSEGWFAIRDGFGWVYQNRAGDTAHWCSELAPTHAGDDYTACDVFMLNRRGKPQQPLRRGSTYSTA